MHVSISATDQIRPDYDCSSIPLKFGGRIVGFVTVFPEALRRAAFEANVQQAGILKGFGVGPRQATEEEQRVFADANVGAIATVLHVCETLKETPLASEWLTMLAADTFLQAGDFPPSRLEYLSQGGLRTLTLPTIQTQMRDAVDSGEARKIKPYRKLFNDATRLRRGPKRHIEHAQRRDVLVQTSKEIAPHIQKLRKCRNPRSYFMQWKDTPIGERIVLAELDADWFPTNGKKPASLERITAEDMAAELMTAEGWGGPEAIRKEARPKKRRN